MTTFTGSFKTKLKAIWLKMLWLSKINFSYRHTCYPEKNATSEITNSSDFLRVCNKTPGSNLLKLHIIKSVKLQPTPKKKKEKVLISFQAKRTSWCWLISFFKLQALSSTEMDRKSRHCFLRYKKWITFTVPKKYLTERVE